MAYYRDKRTVEAEPPPLFPEAVSNFMQRRLIEGAGIVLILSAVLLCAALLSFDSADPSFNTAGGTPIIHNILGRLGAFTADLMLQGFGLIAYLPPLMLTGWGARLILKLDFTRPLLRLTVAAGAMIFLAGAAAALGGNGAWPYSLLSGGAVGMVVLHSLTALMPGAWAHFTALWPALIALAIGSVMAISALGFSYGQWGRGAYRVALVIASLFIMVYNAGLWLWAHRPRGLDGDAGDRPRYRPLLTEKTLRDGNDDDAYDSDDDDSETYENEDAATEENEEEEELPLHGGRSESKPKRLSPFRKRRMTETSAGRYEYPPMELLALPTDRGQRVSEGQLEQTAEDLIGVLNDFSVEGQILKGSPGPVVTLYELEPAPGTKSARVIGLADDIARQMSAISVRVATVPGRNVLGIEIPNAKRETVFLRELLAHASYNKTNAKLPLALGKDIGGEPVVTDLARMPHLLVAGTTGSGKSVSVNTMILSLLYRFTPEQVKMIMIDPKMLELSIYEGIPHLLAPVVTDPKKAVLALKWAVREMEDRYRAMSKLSVRNIDGYNERVRQAKEAGEVITRRVQTGFDADTGKPIFEEQPFDLNELPYIVVIVDEMADLMLVAGKDIEAAIQRLAQMARAAGIHLIMATQRPSVDVITGTIKANFPSRIAFQVTSKIDSRTILNEMGAEQLLGQGDMLYMAGGGRITRVHGAFASDHEVEAVVRHLKAQGEPSYLETVTVDEEGGADVFGGVGSGGEGGEADELYDRAVQIVLRERKASTSYLQRCLRIGYNSAARLIDRMESEGLVSQANHVGKREILVPGESAR